jgi:hypothetical protein
MIKRMDMEKQIVLVSPYFRSLNKARQIELDECLARNAENPLIDRIVLLIDDGAPVPIQSAKIEIRPLRSRPTYADWIAVTEDMSLEGPVLLANSDIYFDDSLSLVHQVLDETSVFMALSRWEVEGGNTKLHSNPHWSQDVWAISAGHADLQHLRERLGFKLGVPRCDNKVAYVFATSGWSVRNPCNYLRSYHLQESQVRNYDKNADTTIVGGVAYVEPSPALNRNSALHYDIWSVKAHEVVKVTVNNSLEKWRLESAATPAVPVGAVPKSEKPPSTTKPGSRQDLFANGSRIYANHAGMGIYVKGDSLLAVPSFNPREWKVIDKSKPLPTEVARQFFSPVLDVHLDDIGERPKHDHDVSFWQYPCRTEQQALENHLTIQKPSINHASRTINLYVPLPWATYIDNKQFPEPIFKTVSNRLEFLTHLARSLGYTLKAHTVCQHIRWRNMCEIAVRIGMTDLHISHCTAQARTELAATDANLSLHPWTLYAVNFCDPARNKGLVLGKPMRARKYLASFIGAYMPHYLSDIRARLHEGLSALQADDVVIDLGDLWHFNQVVYDHQVKRKHTTEDIPVDLEDKTVRYNKVLSDTRFSLCPEGAGPNTLRFWESIASGAIPVLFNRTLEFPKQIRDELNQLCVFWESPDFGRALLEKLRTYSSDEIENRSQALRKLFLKIVQLRCF